MILNNHFLCETKLLSKVKLKLAPGVFVPIEICFGVIVHSFSYPPLNQLGKISQEQFEYFINQTPAERNAQAERADEIFFSKIIQGDHPNSFFSQTDTGSKDVTQPRNLSVDNDAEQTGHQKAHEPVKAATITLPYF